MSGKSAHKKTYQRHGDWAGWSVRPTRRGWLVHQWCAITASYTDGLWHVPASEGPTDYESAERIAYLCQIGELGRCLRRPIKVV